MTGGPPRLVVVGSINLDLTFRTPHLPRPGETVLGLSLLQGHGGKGANQAVMAAKLGAGVTMVGRVGRDAFGEAALANLRDHRIDVRFVGVDPDRPTGVATIAVDDAGQNTIVVAPGANAGVTADDARAVAEAIRSAGWVLAQFETPIAATRAAFELARSAGARTLLNPAPAMDLPDDLLALCDLCVPNESELARLTGRPVADVEDAAEALRRRGPRAVVVTLGARGALVVDDSGAMTVPAPAVTAVDASGAGDAFIGALAVGLAEERSLREAAGWACAAAALSVTRPGTQASFPTRAEVRAVP
jgi:ribokinase